MFDWEVSHLHSVGFGKRTWGEMGGDGGRWGEMGGVAGDGTGCVVDL